MPKQKNGIKYCPRCKRELPIDLFGSDASTSDGLQTYCKVCKRQSLREHRAKNNNISVDNKKLKLIRKMLIMLEPYKTKGAVR